MADSVCTCSGPAARGCEKRYGCDGTHGYALLLDSDVLCVGRGACLARGAARDVLTPDLLAQLYGVDVGIGTVKDDLGCIAPACAPFLQDECQEGDNDYEHC